MASKTELFRFYNDHFSVSVSCDSYKTHSSASPERKSICTWKPATIFEIWSQRIYACICFLKFQRKKKKRKMNLVEKKTNKSNPTQPKRWFGQIFGPVNRVSALFPSDVIVLKWLFSWAPYHLKELEAFEKWAINLGLGREELPRLCCRRLPRLLA